MPLPKIGEKAYRDAEGLNKSLLVPFMRSPQHYIHELNNPKEATPSMNAGTALHALLLQPDRADDIFAVCRKVDRRKTADKEYLAQFEAENAGKVIIDEETHEDVLGMSKAVMAHPEAHRLIESSTHREQALFADYKCKTVDHTIKLKAMADALNQQGGMLVDVKSTENASPSEFAKKVRAFRYDIQQVHYQYCAAVNGIAPSEFFFVVVENAKPYGVAVYKLDPDRIEKVTHEWVQALEYFGHCHLKQDFSASYPDVATILSF